MLKPYIEKMLQKQSLSCAESEDALNIILAQENPYQATAFLTLLHAKGETVDEILGIVKTMQRNMISVSLEHPVLDIVGTGGDGSNSLNISTAAGLLAAACGARVAKHGNRSSSSLCGSADFIEALGIPFEAEPQSIVQSIQKHHFGFLFAPHFHPAAKKLAPIRKGLRFRTVFNLIGPLLNPAKAQYQLIGVSHPELLSPIASVVHKLGTVKTLVFNGNGLDEISCIGPTDVLEVTANGITSYQIDPRDYKLPLCQREDLQGGQPQENAAILKEVFAGIRQGPIADTLALNAGVSLWVYGTSDSIESGIKLAQKTLQAGKVMHLIQRMVKP